MAGCAKLPTRGDLIKQVEILSDLQRKVATEQGQINKVVADTENFLDKQKRKVQTHQYNVTQTFAEIEKESKRCSELLLALIN